MASAPMDASQNLSNRSDLIVDNEPCFRATLERVAWIVWRADASGCWLIDSPTWNASIGMKLPCDWTTCVHVDDRDSVVRSLQYCVAHQLPFHAEFRIQCESTGWRWVEAYAVPNLSDQQQSAHWAGFFLDISSRKQTELRLIKNERHFNLALDLTRMSFWSLNPQTGYVFMDARMRNIWGETNDDEYVSLDRALSRIHPEDRQLVAESVNVALDPNGTGIYRPTDYRLILDDGQIRWVAANGMTMYSGRGDKRQAIELFGTCHDITERKLIEDSLRESEERLQQLNAQLEDRVRERTSELVDSEARLRAAVELAEQSSRQMRRLALELSRTEERERRRLAQILHDHVQQLLIAAKMRVEALPQSKETSETAEQLVGITTVLDMALSATRSLAVEMVPPVLHTQGLPTALQWLAVHIGDQHNLIVETDIDNTANPTSEEARDLLFQSARELLLNVIKHAGVSQAWLDLTRQAGRIRLTVRDHGNGFEPASRSDEGPTFGLFHLRERLAALGGQLEIESRPKHGTCVTASLAM